MQTNSQRQTVASMQVPSISKQPTLRLGADWLSSEEPEVTETFLSSLSEHAIAALPYLFEFWALPHQLPPADVWRTWVVLGGRGAGKTRAGAEWVRREVEGPRPLDPGRSRRIALVGETYDQVRDVMVQGESGILACCPPDRKPTWVATKRQLEWPNGATAKCYSANDPEALRGPQFDAAWVDELAKWPKPDETWDMLQFALRLGDRPRQVVTTTPRAVPLLKQIINLTSTVMTTAPTEANRAYLAASFLEEIRLRYAGTRLGRQELDGVLLDDVEGALWTSEAIEANRVETVPVLDRIVVAVDPPVTGHKGSDDCGIVVAGLAAQGDPRNWKAYVLEDATVSAKTPLQWAEAAVEAAARHQAERVVAEVNQGGDLVETVLRQVDDLMPYRAVRATRGKAVRAEPVAALYEQGRVKHVRGLGDLEDQMCQMTNHGFKGKGSPDRVDALVWALTELLLDAPKPKADPQIRTL